MPDRPIVIVSADDHASPPAEVFREYLDTRYHDALDEYVTLPAVSILNKMVAEKPAPEVLAIIDKEELDEGGGRLGAYDLGRKIQELDREGIAGALMSPGAPPWGVTALFAADDEPRSPEFRLAGSRANHRWMADMMADAEGRLVGTAVPAPCLDMDEAVRDLEWVADNGFVSVLVPGYVADAALPPLYDPHFEPFWAACEDLSLVLMLHGGWGNAQGAIGEKARQFVAMIGAAGVDYSSARSDVLETVETGNMVHNDLPVRMVASELMLGGVFDRHPDLKLMLTEMRADWVPAHVAHLDQLADHGQSRLALKPSEYWQRHVWVTASSIRRTEVEMRHEIGLDRLMFGTDYPHPEGTWPNTWDWIRVAFDGIPEADTRAILGENAFSCFRLDREKVTAVAERIGPRTGDVFGHGHEVDSRMIDHFGKRAGFNKPVAPHPEADIERLFGEIDAGVAAAASH